MLLWDCKREALRGLGVNTVEHWRGEVGKHDSPLLELFYGAQILVTTK